MIYLTPFYPKAVIHANASRHTHTDTDRERKRERVSEGMFLSKRELGVEG